MSVQYPLHGFSGQGSESGPPANALRASIAKEMRYLLAISVNASKPNGVRQAGIAHSLGVCLIEDWNMARGKGRVGDAKQQTGLPTFVDVKLTEEDRENFLAWLGDGADPVTVLQALADDGYRVGVAWSGEHQTYTVSVTCRDTESENVGLCMTSFSRSLPQGVLLAWYKHDIVCRRKWKAFEPQPTDVFG